LTFAGLRSAIFENLTFAGFVTAVAFATHNIDTSHVKFIDCEWSDCNLGVDTTSYALSRSTVLVLERCRVGSGVLRWIDNYCDMCIIRDAHCRNGSGSQAFIRSDGHLIIDGGVYTPYVASASASPASGAAWIELHDTESYSGSAVPSRSLDIDNARFGAENGGLPIVFNKVRGATGKGLRYGPHIRIGEGVQAAISGDDTTKTLIVLMDVETDSTTKSAAPNSIIFNAATWSATNGIVSTESGNAVGVGSTIFLVGQCNISIGYAAFYTMSATDTDPPRAWVESGLEMYVADWFGFPKEITTTGDFTLQVGRRDAFIMNAGSASKIVGFSDCPDGHNFRIIFRNSNTTVEDDSVDGSRIFIGGSSITPTADDVLGLIRDRAAGDFLRTFYTQN
jgi:hypothetical protein